MQDLTHPKQILVPTDFTEVGDCAIQHGIKLAKIFKSELSLLHIIDNTTKKTFKESADFKKSAQSKLSEIAEQIKVKEDLIVNVILEEGSIFDKIKEIGEKINSHLIVMGTHGRKGMQFITKSYALKVIGDSKVPFVVVQTKPPKDETYKSIVLPLDISKEAKEKVIWAIYYGKMFRSKIHILVANETDSYLAKLVKNNLIYTKKLFDKNEIEYEINVSEGNSNNVSEEAIAFAKKIDSGLIIIMTTKQYGIDDFIMGAQEQRLITNSEGIAVMCVNPRKDLTIRGGIK